MKDNTSSTATAPKQSLAPLASPSNAKKNKKPAIDHAKEAKYLAEARRFSSQENYTQALCCYDQYSEKTNPEIAQEIHFCQMQLLRRYLKQGKRDLFTSTKASYGWKEHLALPLARMQGELSLQALAEEENGVDATLAACLLEKDLKTALMRLRKLPLYKEMAEGWLCLLKGNFTLAQSTFETAKLKLPRAASIGIALANIGLGKIKDAQKFLEPFRAHLSRRNPKLAQAMRWCCADASKEYFHSLFNASSSEIEKALRQRNQPDLPNAMKGWLLLRAGDRLWAETQRCKDEDRPWHRILTYWKQAEDTHRPLKIDVAKRRLVVSYNECPSLYVETEWPLVCTLLKNHNPEQLNTYLTYIAHLPETDLPYIPLCVFRKTSTSSNPRRFLVNPPPAFYLLYYRLATRMLRQLDQCLQLPRCLTLKNLSLLMMSLNAQGVGFEKMDELNWNDLATLLPLLDQTYMHEPDYLNARYSIARIMGDAEKMRTAMYHFLLCDPSQKGLLIPRFISALFQEVRAQRFRILGKALHHSKKRRELAKQLKLLHQKFPDDYDITRLMLLCRYPKKEVQKHIITHASHLSGQLARILHCQILIDIGANQATVLKALPEWKSCQGHPEAQERWLQLTLAPALKARKKWPEALVNLEAERLHAILKRIETRGERLFPSSFLRSLVVKYGESPYIIYHLALQMLRQEKSFSQTARGFNKLVDCLKGLDDLHPEGNPDRESLIPTLRVFAACSTMTFKDHS